MTRVPSHSPPSSRAHPQLACPLGFTFCPRQRLRLSAVKGTVPGPSPESGTNSMEFRAFFSSRELGELLKDQWPRRQGKNSLNHSTGRLVLMVRFLGCSGKQVAWAPGGGRVCPGATCPRGDRQAGSAATGSPALLPFVARGGRGRASPARPRQLSSCACRARGGRRAASSHPPGSQPLCVASGAAVLALRVCRAVPRRWRGAARRPVRRGRSGGGHGPRHPAH